jgi:hypothetical protein
MEDIHNQSLEAFVTALCSKSLPSFDEITYRMWYNIGWDIGTIKQALLVINKVTDRQVYKHHSDTTKIKAASLRHRDYLRSQLTK